MYEYLIHTRYFTAGTKVAVYGTQDSVDVDGQATTSYAVDGVIVGSYTAPIIAPGYVTTGTLFFQSKDLVNGMHTLVITTTNGTQPNRFLLDYFSYTGLPIVPSSSSPQSSSPQPSPSLSSSSLSWSPLSLGPSLSSSLPSSSLSSPSLSSPSPSPQSSLSLTLSSSSLSLSPLSLSMSSITGSNDAPGSTAILPSTNSAVPGSSQSPLATHTSSSRTRVGAIVGGVLGGIALLVAALPLFMFKKRKNRKKESLPQEVHLPGESFSLY